MWVFSRNEGLSACLSLEVGSLAPLLSELLFCELSTFTIIAWYHRPDASIASTAFLIIDPFRGSPSPSNPRRRSLKIASSSAILRLAVALAAASRGHEYLPSLLATAYSSIKRMPSDSPMLSTECWSEYASHLPSNFSYADVLTGISAYRFLQSSTHGPKLLAGFGTLPLGTSNLHSRALPSV